MQIGNIMSKLSSLVIVFLLSTTTMANTIKGKVMDSFGVAIQGAIVEIPDLKTGVVTDTGGYYSIKDLPGGNYTIEVHELGFATIHRMVKIEYVTILDFVMHESVLEKNEIVITGTSLATEERKSITPIQSMTLKEMRENASSNIIDAITSIPGVSAISTGASISKPVIRGLGYNRVITLNDGVRQEGQQWGDEHGIEIDDYNVTRVEVLKGPASLAYGSDAMAGVVNIISTPNIPEGKMTGNVAANYQTNSGLSALHAEIGGNKNGVSWQVYGTQKIAHDFSNKYDGAVFNSRFQNTNFGASWGINKKWGFLKAYVTSYELKTGLPEGDRDSATGSFIKTENINGVATDAIVNASDAKSYAMSVPYQDIVHRKLVLENSYYLNNGGRIGLVVGYQRNERKEFGDVLAPDEPGLSLLLQTATYDLKYYLPQVKGWNVTTGLNGMSQWNNNEGTEYLIPDYRLFDGGLFIMGKKEINKWSVAGGLRYDIRNMEVYSKDIVLGQMPTIQHYEIFHTIRNNFPGVSGSLGVSYEANKSNIFKANLSSGYRAPNIAELASNGVHEGTFRYEIGNPGLKPENSVQADLGYQWSSEHLFVNVALFDNYINHYIFVRKMAIAPASIAANNPDNFDAFTYSQGEANLYGGELYIDYHQHPFDWIHFENTFSYVRGKLLNAVDGNSNLPYMPPFKWLTELRAQRRNIGKYLKNAYAKVGLEFNAEQNNVFSAYNTETSTPGYTLLDAGIGADICNKQHKTILTLTIAGQNLTDVAYQNFLNRLRYAPENYATGRMGIYNMGRNFSVMCSVPLTFGSR